MKTIPVKTSLGDYSILIGTDLIGEAGALLEKYKLPARVLIITQEKVAKFFLKPLKKSLEAKKIKYDVHLVPDGEKAKSQEELFKIFRALVLKGYERGDALIGLGGGVVGDLTGFAASVYLRGVPYINIGTTLLAQVDSSIGGKTAVNLREGKNLVGTFYPPRLVISDAAALKTLPERELRSSLAEVVKYGVIRDPVLFRTLEKYPRQILNKDARLLQTLVWKSAGIKAGVVSRDEFETKGERLILNYGHTFGHAFEKVSQYKLYLHGEAVSVGMVCAARLAVHMRLLSPPEEERQNRLLISLGLPVKLQKKFDAGEILESMLRDKKKKSGKLRFILPTAIGKVIVRDDVSEKQIFTVLREVGA